MSQKQVLECFELARHNGAELLIEAVEEKSLTDAYYAASQLIGELERAIIAYKRFEESMERTK